MLALSLQDVPSDSPAARGLPPPSRAPGPLAPTDGSHLPIPNDPPRLHTRPSARSVAEAGLRAGAARRPARQPWTARWAPRGPRPWRAGHARSPAGRPLPPGCSRRTPAWTPSPPTSSSCGHPAVAGRATDMADLSTVRTSQFKVAAQPMGTDPVRTATAKRRTPPPPSVRPCAWPADHGQPRCPLILAMTGQDDNAHARLRPTPAATSTGTHPP
jgi:hypothetical protein